MISLELISPDPGYSFVSVGLQETLKALLLLEIRSNEQKPICAVAILAQVGPKGPTLVPAVLVRGVADKKTARPSSCFLLGPPPSRPGPRLP